MYSECSRFHPNRFSVLGHAIAEHMNTAKSRPKVIQLLDSKHCFEANNTETHMVGYAIRYDVIRDDNIYVRSKADGRASLI